MPVSVLTVVGARPQFIKAAAVSTAIAASNRGIRETIVHTGQHYDTRLSEIFFDELVIPAPAYNLAVGSAGHGAQTGEMMARLEPIVDSTAPDWVLTYGDTNSTLAAALVAAKLHTPVAHVEAGLRSFNMRMPEEINRIVTDRVSSLLLCPSDAAVANLAAEGIRDGVHMVGDVMLDVLLKTTSHLSDGDDVAARLGLRAGDYVVATIHRAENTDDGERFGEIFAALNEIAADVAPVLWPVHPRVRDRLADASTHCRLHLHEPLSYREMIAALRHARAVVTDSGGLQKEAMWSGSPCITVREETEWTETVDAGWNRLVGASREAIVGAAALTTRPARPAPTLYGDGHAAEAVVDRLLAATA